MFRSRLLAAALAICAARCRIAGAGAGAVLQGQAAHADGQLRRRLRRPTSRRRVFARHFAKHIDGAAAAHRAEHGRRRRRQRHAVSRRGRAQGRHDDGLPHRHRLELRQPSRERFRVDFRTYEFVGYQPAAPRSTTCAPTCRPASSKPTDIVKAKGLVSGGVDAAHRPRHLDPARRSTCSACRSSTSPAIAAASARGSRCSARRSISIPTRTPGYRGAVEATLVKDGTVIPLWYDPNWDGKTFGKSKQVEGLTDQAVPRVLSGASSARCRPARSGTPISRCITLNGAMQRMLSLPPGAPPAAVAALRAALERLNNDKDYAEATQDDRLRAGIRRRRPRPTAGAPRADRASGDPGLRRRLHQAARTSSREGNAGGCRCR